MEAYKVVENLYRIPGGYGNSGEVYGGLLINDNPTIVIGASGRGRFLSNLKDIISELQLEHDFRLYLTSTTYEEVRTLEMVRKEFPDATFYIHKYVAQLVKSPRKLFLEGRFGKYNEEAVEKMSRKLPKSINNIVEIDKRSSFKAANTKILIIPFSGPHRGHTFIYSTAQKMLCSGLIGGYSSTNKRLYYMDFTGSVENYKNAFSFLKQAEAEIIAPAYEEPQLKTSGGLSTIEVENAIESDIKNVYELCALLPKSFDKILREFRNYYGFDISTPPYHEIKLDAALVEYNLNQLITDGKVITKEGKFRRT